MRTIADHILDISSNSTSAGATKVWLDIVEDTASGTFVFAVRDNGRGMPPAVQEQVFDPFFTTRPHQIRRFGLGLPFLRENAELTGGEVELTSQPGVGTTVQATFHTDNIDCLPVGDIASTLFTLLVSGFSVEWNISRTHDDLVYTVQTEELLGVFTVDELSDPEAQMLLLKYLRDQEKAVCGYG
ncbi:MAG: ATP-binding protein [Candidatus Cryosericum sp.]